MFAYPTKEKTKKTPRRGKEGTARLHPKKAPPHFAGKEERTIYASPYIYLFSVEAAAEGRQKGKKKRERQVDALSSIPSSLSRTQGKWLFSQH